VTCLEAAVRGRVAAKRALARAREGAPLQVGWCEEQDPSAYRAACESEYPLQAAWWRGFARTIRDSGFILESAPPNQLWLVHEWAVEEEGRDSCAVLWHIDRSMCPITCGNLKCRMWRNK